MRLLCVGHTWRGANEGSLFKGLIKNGSIVDLIETNAYFPRSTNNIILKVSDRVLLNQREKAFNKSILDAAELNKPDVAIFYKSVEVLPHTIMCLKERGIFTVNVYPDVSFFTHGNNLIKTIPLYDLIVSTKSFAKKDMMDNFNYDKVEFLPHGFDTELHRRVNITNSLPSAYFSDCVFIGAYSKNKEEYLAHLIKYLPDPSIKIWGSNWEKRSQRMLISEHILGQSVFGDYYSLAIQNSKIALGLLSEKVKGASSGDLITARTFEIPGVGTFMLHQRTPEIQNYFIEDEEIACFDTVDELVDKVSFYLKHADAREKIALKGKERAWRDHTYEKRAQQLVEIIKKHF